MLTKMKNTLLITIVLLCSSCATKYGPENYLGGYSELRVSNDMYRVSFVGNEATTQEWNYRMFLRRAAELTIQSGFTHFTLADQLKDKVIVSSGVIKMINNPAKDVTAYDAKTVIAETQRLVD